MTDERRAKLEAAGHKVQSAEKFFQLDTTEQHTVKQWLKLFRETGHYLGSAKLVQLEKTAPHE